MRFCTQCGKPLTATAQFCPGCGAVVRTAAPSPPPPLPSPPPPPGVFAPNTANAPNAPQPPRQQHGRGPLIAVAIAAALAIFVASGVIVWALTRGESHDEGRAGGLNVQEATFAQGRSLKGEPGTDWFFDPSDIMSGGHVDPLFYDWYQPTVDAYAFDDTVVVRVSNGGGGGDGDNVLVGLDVDDGSVRWQEDQGDGSFDCWRMSDDYLLCGGPDTDGDDLSDGLRSLDPTTGKVIAESDLASDYGTPLLDSGTLFVALAESGYGVAALDAASLKTIWHTTQVSVPAVESGDPRRYEFGLEGRQLRVQYPDFAYAAFDRYSGSVLSVRPAIDNHLSGGDGWTVKRPWVDENDTTTVIDPSGRAALSVVGEPWNAHDYDTSSVHDATIGIAGSLHDLSDGKVLWSRDDLDAEFGWSWTEDWRNVIATDGVDNVVLSASSGETLWTYPNDDEASEGEGFSVTEFRGDAALTLDPDTEELTAFDRDNGDTAWRRDIGGLGLNDQGIPATLEIGPRSVVVPGPNGVHGFTDFPDRAGGTHSQGEGADTDDVAYTTKCGKPPTFVPVETELAGGGITITYEVHAVCPGGQWLNLSQLRVPVVVDGYIYADGYFDFSDTPYWITDDGASSGGSGTTRLRLTYDFTNTTVPYADMTKAIAADKGTGKAVVVPCETGPDNTDDAAVPSDPAFGGDTDEAIGSSGAPATDDAQTQESALEALQRIAAEDKDKVGGLQWTAQLSSKKPGTYDDGIVYDSYDDILALHLEYRSRYPESLLAWSNDWPGSFGPSSQNYWVTLGGQSEATTIPILEWCHAEGWGDGDCWAKRLLTTGNPDKESRHKDSWPPDPSKN